MIDFILKAWPYLLAAGSAIAAFFVKQSADKTKAQAAQQVAEAKQQQAEINAAAAQSSVDAIKERTNVESDIAAHPGESGQRLRDEWSRD